MAYQGTRQKSEFDQKTLDLRRVTRVVAGGKRFSFRATVVVGNRNGKVGVGLAKGNDVAKAIDKAVRLAKRELVIVPVTNKTIPHEIEAKFGSARVRLKPAPIGRGIIAGGPVRVVCELAGIENISAKILGGTKNKLTNALATLEALKSLRTRESKGKREKAVKKQAEELRTATLQEAK